MIRKQTKQNQRKPEEHKTRRPIGPGRERPVTTLGEPDLMALQRAVANPALAASADVLALQYRCGNRAVQRLLAQRGLGSGQQRESRSANEVDWNGGGGVVQRLTDISGEEESQARDGTKIKVHPYKKGDYNCHGLTFDCGPQFGFSPLSSEVTKLLEAEGATKKGKADKINNLKGTKLEKGDVAEFKGKGSTESAHTSRILKTTDVKEAGDAIMVKVKQRDKFGRGVEPGYLGIHASSGYPVTIWQGLPKKVTTGPKTTEGKAYRKKKA